MIMMFVGLLLFLGPHIFTTNRAARAAVIARIGEGPYKLLYAVVSTLGVLITAYGFGEWRSEGPRQLYHPLVAMRHVNFLLMLIASIAAVSAYVPSHIRAWLKQPLLVAVKIWALAHILVNGDAASLTLFLIILAWAVYDRIAVKRRGDPLPVAPKGWGGDVVAVLGGLVLYAALVFLFHPYVVRVPLIPV
ncbi:NnrU family protein [Ancylobacter sp. 6x-1]|uniref:NnrU family protein n=1 Tax=Ancylobacter crimeensis TaxID=2579147 RepID=A0ABT0D629_9HYPH|nr:NnrU family protein [Ancylobacter crimeensis]MCK0195400.1 NnrU family protein [Ancylobacter crimeensis]